MIGDTVCRKFMSCHIRIARCANKFHAWPEEEATSTMTCFSIGWLSATWDFARRSSMWCISTPGQSSNGWKFYLNHHHNVTAVRLQDLTSSPISTNPYITFNMYVGQMRFRAILGAQLNGLAPSYLRQLSNMYTVAMSANSSKPICGWSCQIHLL